MINFGLRMDAMAAVNILQGAHIGTGHQSNTNLPSIFDYLAQESLQTSIKPGLLALFKYFGQFFPEISFAQKCFDEFYLLFEAILENHYLKKFSASFSENFYGLKRVPLRMGNSLGTFRRRIRSLFILVFIPYFVEKIEKLHEKLIIEQRESSNTGWHRLLLRFYPRIKGFIQLGFFLFQVGYAFSLTSIPSPLLLLAGFRIEKLSPEDIERIQSFGSQTPFHMRQGSLFSTIWRFFLWLPSAIVRLLSYGLFFLQFFEYFYTDELGKRFGEIIGGQRVQIAEFPIHTLPSEQQILCMHVDKCPICMRIRQQDTVLSVSGYVFCHSCIYNFVRLKGHCPITSLPATTSELVKIYH